MFVLISGPLGVPECVRSYQFGHVLLPKMVRASKNGHQSIRNVPYHPYTVGTRELRHFGNTWGDFWLYGSVIECGIPTVRSRLTTKMQFTPPDSHKSDGDVPYFPHTVGTHELLWTF